MADTSPKKRILITMIEVGGCHASIAYAVQDALMLSCPGMYDIQVVDLPRACGARGMDRHLKHLWRMALARPVLTTRLSTWLEEVGTLANSNRIVRLLFGEFVRKGMRFIEQANPDLVISTHFFCTSVAVFARQQSGGTYPVVSHVSDPFRAHGLWVNPLADEVIVCSQAVRDQLAAMGQPSERLSVLPFPINPRFFAPIGSDRTAVLQALNLSPERLTILASAGGEGVGNMSSFLRRLYLSELPCNVIAVCGRNERLHKELSLLAMRDSPVRMAVLGFVRNMNELAEAADVGMVKAGPSSLLELLAKDCPVMVTQVAAKIEEGNLRFVMDNGFGWDVREPEAFDKALRNLRDPSFLAQAGERIRKSGALAELPGAAARVAERIVARLPAGTDRPTR
jgi:UDP-N-acetylglucosamine:LPS N-acetylglucosamine transferase